MLIAVRLGAFRQGWSQILAFGIALFAVTSLVLRATGNPNLLPTVILLGALVVPVTFVVYFYRLSFVRDRDISLPLLTMCFVVGGIVGMVAAGLVEYATLRGSGIPV